MLVVGIFFVVVVMIVVVSRVRFGMVVAGVVIVAVVVAGVVVFVCVLPADRACMLMAGVRGMGGVIVVQGAGGVGGTACECGKSPLLDGWEPAIFGVEGHSSADAQEGDQRPNERFAYGTYH